MRELQEIQAEVFRRSEKKIEARKKRRNRILMTCVPMVLGITVITAALWPRDPASSGSGTPENATYAPLSEVVAESSTCSIAKIEVVGHDVLLSYVETEDIMKITDFLDRCTAQKPERAPIEPEDSQQVPESATVAPESAPEAPTDNNTVSGGRGEDTAESGNKHSVSPGIFDSYSTTLTEGLTITVTDESGSQTQYSLDENTLTDLTNHKVYILTPEQTKELKTLLGVSTP